MAEVPLGEEVPIGEDPLERERDKEPLQLPGDGPPGRVHDDIENDRKPNPDEAEDVGTPRADDGR
jgi:hypothetical protein